MELFAQQPPPPDPGFILGILAFYAVVFVIAIGITVLFLLTMSRCLKQISPRNRQMSPGQVWLCLIPIFGFVWTIIMIIRVADSLRDEYSDRGLRGDGDYGKTLGIIYIVTSFLCGPIGLICFIMYWVKIAGYTKELASRGHYDDFDDEDDRPSRRRTRDEDDRPRRRPSREEDDDRDEDDRPSRPWDRGGR